MEPLIESSTHTPATGNAYADAFLVHEKISILDTVDPDKKWSDIEQRFKAWWAKFQTCHYAEWDDKQEKKDYQEALRVLGAKFNGWCLLMLPLDLLCLFSSGLTKIRHRFRLWQSGISLDKDGEWSLRKNKK